MRNSYHCSRSRAAVTLFELVIALVVLALISGTIFSIIAGSVRATAEVQVIQKEADQIHAFSETCRRVFGALPDTAQITISIIDEGPPALQELVLSGAANAFAFGEEPVSYEDLTIGTFLDGQAEDGTLLYTIGITRSDILPGEIQEDLVVTDDEEVLLAPDDDGRYWLPLIRNVVALNWRCYTADDDEWIELWEGQDWPDLLEVTILQQGRLLPLRTVIELPERPEGTGA